MSYTKTKNQPKEPRQVKTKQKEPNEPKATKTSKISQNEPKRGNITHNQQQHSLYPMQKSLYSRTVLRHFLKTTARSLFIYMINHFV